MAKGGTCSICGGTGRITIQKIINGKKVGVSVPCPTGRGH